MRRHNPTHNIKREKKKSLLFREISTFVQSIATDDPALAHTMVTRVDLSADGGICYIYFFPREGRATADHVLEQLKLYRPSLRSALAHSLSTRYTPDLQFRFDEGMEREQRINELLDKVREHDDDSDGTL
jgi:ribosome-binding factor A